MRMFISETVLNLKLLNFNQKRRTYNGLSIFWPLSSFKIQCTSWIFCFNHCLHYVYVCKEEKILNANDKRRRTMMKVKEERVLALNRAWGGWKNSGKTRQDFTHMLVHKYIIIYGVRESE